VAFLLHVLVPAYGPSPYLAETLSTALLAGDADTLITVVDDGSPTEHVRATAAAAGVEVVRLDVNRGVAGAFQACIDLSRGDYSVLLGSDDLLLPSYVAEVRRLVAAHDAPAIVQPGVEVVDERGAPIFPLTDRVKRLLTPSEEGALAGDRLAASLLLGNWLYFPSLAWRTDLLREYGFRSDMQTALDLDLELRLVFGGASVAFSPEPAFRYRRHAGSASSQSALDGERFVEESSLYRWAAQQSRARGWWRSGLAARAHPTSRLHSALARASRLTGPAGR
jgi:glycosyltransferase involved in cell wall biosynthesis